jgi:hypothetical protein
VLGSEFDGKSWGDLDADTLRAALECDDPRVTEAHKEFIVIALEEKAGVA